MEKLRAKKNLVKIKIGLCLVGTKESFKRKIEGERNKSTKNTMLAKIQ